MKRGTNKAFLEQQGKPAGVRRGPDGKLTSSRSEQGRKFALDMLGDPAYQKSLRERLIAGVAGSVEVHLLRLAFGEPPKADSERDADESRFRQMRASVLGFLEASPDEARVVNAVVTRAPRILELPPRIEPSRDPDSGLDEPD